MNTLPVRTTEAPLTGLTTLSIDAEHTTAGLPWITARLPQAVAATVVVTLRIHNKAGIPIIEATTELSSGADQVTFTTLNPLGIEAYAHAPEDRRLEVAQRVWSRRAYATVQCR
jgi:hypothetical protein